MSFVTFPDLNLVGLNVMKRDEPKVVIVTGASAGIGLATAEQFAQRGDKVILVARRAEKLEELRNKLQKQGLDAHVCPTDLADHKQCVTLCPKVMAKHGRIDVLINNAGYGKQQLFAEMSDEDVARMFTVNVLSAISLARCAAMFMQAQKSGCIVNVASVGGVVAHPLNVAYCATKHALVGFSKSLRLELKGSGVSVTVVCPGATRTEFFSVAKGTIPFDNIIERFAVPPERVARAIVKASGKNRAVVFPTFAAWFLATLDKWLPWISAAGNIRYRNKVLELPPNVDEESESSD